MNPTERFRHDEARLHLAIGLQAREVREARGPLAECDAIKAAARHRGGALLLLGNPGTGKSVAAARWLLRPSATLAAWFTVDTALGIEWRYRGAHCLWRTAKGLSRVPQYDEAAIGPLITAGRLVIDDLGAEFLDKGGFLVSLIDEVVNERHRRELPTVLTANLSSKDFAERYGRRVVDRVSERGEPITCGGASMRTRKPSSVTLPAIVLDSEIEARHAELEAELAARESEQRARYEAERLERDGGAGRVVSIRGGLAQLAAEKAAEPTETPDQVAARENAARAEAERRLAEWRGQQGQTA